jgi:hypothetical protein
MQLITMVTRAAQLPKPPLGMKVPFPEFDATHYLRRWGTAPDSWWSRRHGADFSSCSRHAR